MLAQLRTVLLIKEVVRLAECPEHEQLQKQSHLHLFKRNKGYNSADMT